MQKQTTDHHQQQLGRHSVLAASIALALALSACGGGGGGAGDPVVPGPDPNLGKLSITSSNYVAVAQTAVSSSLYFMDSAELLVGAQSSDGKAPTRFALAQLDRLPGWFAKGVGSPVVTGAVSTVSEACAGGGRMDISIDDKNNNGNFDAGDAIAIRAVNCIESGSTMNGGMEMALTSLTGVFGSSNYTATVTMRLDKLTVVTGQDTAIGNGEMRMDTRVSGPYNSSVTITVPSFTVAGTLGGVNYSNSLVGFQLTLGKAPGGTLYNVSVSIRGALSGSMIESKQISVETLAPLVRNWSAVDPSTGQLLIKGAASSQLRITAQASGMALLELDADGNGMFESSTTRRWSDLR